MPLIKTMFYQQTQDTCINITHLCYKVPVAACVVNTIKIHQVYHVQGNSQDIIVDYTIASLRNGDYRYSQPS